MRGYCFFACLMLVSCLNTFMASDLTNSSQSSSPLTRQKTEAAFLSQLVGNFDQQQIKSDQVVNHCECVSELKKRKDNEDQKRIDYEVDFWTGGLDKDRMERRLKELRKERIQQKEAEQCLQTCMNGIGLAYGTYWLWSCCC